MSLIAGGNVLTKYRNFDELIYAIRIGAVPATIAKTVNKFGENGDIDTTTEDVWAPGGTKYDNYTADTIEFLSSSTNDDGDPGGTGARTVTASFIDGNYDEQTETVIMDGTTAVESVGTYIDCFRIAVATTGTGNANAGNITARLKTGGQTVAYVTAGANQTEQTHYIVPDGHTLFLTNVYCGIGGVQGGGGTRVGENVFLVQKAGTTHWLEQEKIPGTSDTGLMESLVKGIPFLQQRDRIKFACEAETSNTKSDVAWLGVLINNNYLSIYT